MSTPYLIGPFGATTLVCPRYGTICSGGHFDCLTSCERWANKRKETRKYLAKHHKESFENSHAKFSDQYRIYVLRKEGDTCPRCYANVPLDKREEHMNFHYNNDAELQW